MSDASHGTISQPVIVERGQLLELVNENARMHIRLGHMHMREARLVGMIADLIHSIDMTTAGRAASQEDDVRGRSARSVARSIIRDLKEMNR